MSLAAFCYGVVAFFAMLGYPASQRSRDLRPSSTWIPAIGRFQVTLGLLLDPLSICFVLLITGVGSLIHIYAVGYMAHDPERRRFFGYLNLFIAAMLLLVLADNYLALYAGWEGVGLASYLLIGFWQFKPAAAAAAKKAFIANRVGDVGLSLAIMLMFATFGSVELHRRLRRGRARQSHGAVTAHRPAAAARRLRQVGAAAAAVLAARRDGGPDPGLGPDPRGDDGHRRGLPDRPVQRRSSTCRPTPGWWSTIVGAATLLFGAIIGCAKDDIKKALAGSTMSQIGYMMLAAGLGPAGYALAIAHLLAHGFFKAGLFLGAGSVKHGMNDEVDMRRFGGLRHGHADHLRHLHVRLPGDHRHPAVLRLLHQGPDHRGGLRQGRHLGRDPRHRRAARRRHHRLLHDPGDADDLRRRAALGRRACTRTRRRR